MELIETLLKEDLRNNSVWNHRYFVIQKTKTWDKQTKQQEIEYASISFHLCFPLPPSLPLSLHSIYIIRKEEGYNSIVMFFCIF
jgi:hypothetical protein